MRALYYMIAISFVLYYNGAAESPTRQAPDPFRAETFHSRPSILSRKLLLTLQPEIKQLTAPCFSNHLDDFA